MGLPRNPIIPYRKDTDEDENDDDNVGHVNPAHCVAVGLGHFAVGRELAEDLEPFNNDLLVPPVSLITSPNPNFQYFSAES
jgi:hypothetical protein